VSVEASGSGFWQDGRPKMRYERHIFHQQTQGRFSAAYPDISNAKSGGSTTGPSEYTRLKQAMALDYLAALRSASWGLPQIMGFNFNLAGFSNVEAMVWAMHQSEANHLKAMGAFLASTNIVAPLRTQDWAKVARLYNGSNYQANRYDEKLALAYNQAINEGWA
jgi:N-acetylmuramidase